MNLLSHFSYFMYYTNVDRGYSNTHMMIAPAILASLMLTGLFVFLAIYVLHAFLLSMIFKKAGVKPWSAWVPFYNIWKLLEIGDQPRFWAILTIITPLNIVTSIFTYIAMYRIGLKFGKDGSWVVLAIFFPTIWMAILAFDGSKWKPKRLNS